VLQHSLLDLPFLFQQQRQRNSRRFRLLFHDVRSENLSQQNKLVSSVGV
jgi:hypothetical protein